MKRLCITLLAAAACCSGLFAQDIDSLLGTLSRREKIAQLIIEAIDSKEDPALRARQEQWIREGLGGLIVMDDGLVDNIQMVNELQTLARIPMIVSIDGEWGAAMRYFEYAAFPRAMQLGALGDETLVEQAGRVIGEELHALKIFVNYAPVIDINNNPKNPVINTRSFGEDREKVARLGAAYVRGMQSAGVWGSAKHFPGHGDTDVDSHKGLPVLTFNRSRLDSLELYPYRRLIDEGVAMIMVGHLSIPALDSTGTPASISKPIVTGLLRNELGYNGIIITDALGMQGVAEGNANAALLAYKAGADILLMPQDTRETIDALDAAFRKGELDEADLDTRVRRVLQLKERAGMLAPGYSPMVDTAGLVQRAKQPESEALIQELCDRSMTVVQGCLRRPLRLHRASPMLPSMPYRRRALNSKPKCSGTAASHVLICRSTPRRRRSTVSARCSGAIAMSSLVSTRASPSRAAAGRNVSQPSSRTNSPGSLAGAGGTACTASTWAIPTT